MRKVVGEIKYKHSIPRKFNYILPGICGLALLLIGWMVINPVEMADEGFAIENSIDVNNTTKATASIGIAWTNPSNLERETNGQSGEVTYRYDTFTLSASKIKQYQIFVNAATGSSGQLEGYLDADRTIPIGNIGGISNADGVIGRNMGANEWGYAVSEGYKTNDAELEQLTYKTVPVASSTTAAFTGTEDTLTDKQFTVAFGANVGADKPAGHYTAYVTVSAVMEPKPLIESITYMQEMTPDICADMPEADTLGNGQYQLTDKRDGKTYWIARLKDGNCWMTQNLDLDLYINGTGRRLTSADSDLTNTWDSSTGPSELWYNDYNNGHPLDKGKIKYYDPGLHFCANNTSEKCDLAASKNDGHDEQGNYYSWTAATASSSIVSNKASGSICPKNWMLPIKGKEIDKTYYNLLKKYNLTSNPSNANYSIISGPLYFTYAGAIGMSASLLDKVGTTGQYWLADYDVNVNGYILYLTSDRADYYYYLNNDMMSYAFAGLSVRCVAR